MKYYLIAGERSGDLHASNLMKGLLRKEPKASFRYFGGDYMQAVGGELVVHYRDMAFMGFWEVLKNLKVIKKLLKQCKQDIDNFQPHAIILVDYAGFNLKIAKYAKARGFKVFYYISPKVWAWNQKRALKIKNRVDFMLSILPFEVDFYKKYDWHNVAYVGNPVVEVIARHRVNPDFLVNHELSDRANLVAVLPGSRKQELQHILPTLTAVIKRYPQYHFCIAVVKNLPIEIYKSVANLDNVTLIVNDTYNLLANAVAAIVTSGTATLETALWDVPQIVVYRSSWFSYRVAKALVKVKFISLVNLILDKEVVTELIQDECTVNNISNELNLLLKQGTNYTMLREKLGDKVASDEAANQITTLCSSSNNN